MALVTAPSLKGHDVSRTDKTRSAASWTRETGISWWHLPDYERRAWQPPTHRGTSRLKASYIRTYWRSERFRTREYLRNGRDPQPSRPRGQVEWKIS